jgi:class 3 adenylate cyclase
MSAEKNQDEVRPEEKSTARSGRPLLAGFKNSIYRFLTRVRSLAVSGFFKLAGSKRFVYRFSAWIQNLRIPIFIKLAALSTLLILLVISAISFSILKEQKKQFIDQLVNLGESMLRIAANNAPDKLLGEEELALFQLVKDIAENEQVLYAFITDKENIIKAHSSIEEVNKVYTAPKHVTLLKETDETKISSFADKKEDILFFEKPITYQNLRVGNVHLAISQKKIEQKIRDAKIFILVLTLIITLVGVLLSLALSTYISRPINKLRESTATIGQGDFTHRVTIKRNDELGDLGSAFNKMAEGLAESQMIRETFGKYVTPEIRDEILSGRIPLNGERREATMLFADLRGFTSYVEENPPEEVIKSMKAYFTAMQKAIRQCDGLVLQYVGDEMEVVFGVPLRDEDHADKAVMAALEMRRLLESLNNRRVNAGLMPFRHGIGIHTGEVLAGNTGSEDQLSYSLIGDTVILASRIQDLTKELHCDILASEETAKRLRRRFELKKELPRMVRGRSKRIVVYRVMG